MGEYISRMVLYGFIILATDVQVMRLSGRKHSSHTGCSDSFMLTGGYIYQYYAHSVPRDECLMGGRDSQKSESFIMTFFF